MQDNGWLLHVKLNPRESEQGSICWGQLGVPVIEAGTQLKRIGRQNSKVTEKGLKHKISTVLENYM